MSNNNGSDTYFFIAFGTFLFGVLTFCMILCLFMAFRQHPSDGTVMGTFLLSFFIGWICAIILEWDEIKDIEE